MVFKAAQATDLVSKFKSFHLPSSRKHYLPDKEYLTKHIRVQLKVDPEQKTIAGSADLRIETLAEGISWLTFDAAEMKIGLVTVDGVETRSDHDGAVLRVRAGVLKVGPHEVTIHYSSRPKHGVYFIRPDGAYPDKPVQVWTQCETEGARYWIPCHDHPDDRSTTETIITAPDGYDVISTGRLVSRRSDGGWTTFHWSEEAPHSTYLNSFVIGKFVKSTDSVDGVPLEYYAPKEKSADTLRYFGQTPEMLRIFVEVTGRKYPFEKYAQVAVHDYVYGGMENISATTLVDTRFPDARSEEDYAVRYSRPDRNHIELVAHELAHMWFGDLVTTRDWSHAWLNEGFATYMEAFYAEKKLGEDEFRVNMRAKALAYFEEDSTRYRRRIVENDYLYADDLFDTCFYEKSSWMIHQLRYRLGDSAFFRAVREYVARFAYKNVDTHDLMRVMEETTGVSLEKQFEQSFYRAGHPEVEAEFAWDEGSRLAQLTLRQTQAVDEANPVFEFPCDLVFYTETGRQKRRVWTRNQTERYSFELDSEPSIVEVDPEGWLLMKLSFRKSRTLLLNQLDRSIDVLSRRQAAEDLSALKDDDEVLERLGSAALREQHWSVRAEAVKSIGRVGGQRALEALLGLAGVKNRRVRRAVIASLAEFKGDERAESAVREALFHDESPYNQCEAALSLAKIRGKGAIEPLRQAMSIPSPESGLTEACLEGLGLTKADEVRPILRENLTYGRATRVRVGALKGMTKLGSLEETDLTMLRDVLAKDPDFVVRSQALATAGELRDSRLREALATVASDDQDNRNRRRAAEILLDLESAEPGAVVGALRDEVEKLKAESAEIRGRVSRLKSSDPGGKG